MTYWEDGERESNEGRRKKGKEEGDHLFFEYSRVRRTQSRSTREEKHWATIENPLLVRRVVKTFPSSFRCQWSKSPFFSFCRNHDHPSSTNFLVCLIFCAPSAPAPLSHPSIHVLYPYFINITHWCPTGKGRKKHRIGLALARKATTTDSLPTPASGH